MVKTVSLVGVAMVAKLLHEIVLVKVGMGGWVSLGILFVKTDFLTFKIL